MTESELVARCRRRDREAQHELYTRTSERIYRLLVRMTRNQDAAFDLAQNTYLRAFTMIDQFDGRSTLATWLYRVAVTEALQFLRREKRRSAKVQEGAAETATCSSDQQSIARLDVNEALATLEPADQAVLLLRYQEGLDYRAIAKSMDCAEGTVASRLHRARERLRHLLGGSYAPREETVPPRHQTDGRAGRAGSPAGPGQPESREQSRK